LIGLLTVVEVGAINLGRSAVFWEIKVKDAKSFRFSKDYRKKIYHALQRTF
jgi:hypothetical protein